MCLSVCCRVEVLLEVRVRKTTNGGTSEEPDDVNALLHSSPPSSFSFSFLSFFDWSFLSLPSRQGACFFPRKYTESRPLFLPINGRRLQNCFMCIRKYHHKGGYHPSYLRLFLSPSLPQLFHVCSSFTKIPTHQGSKEKKHQKRAMWREGTLLVWGGAFLATTVFLTYFFNNNNGPSGEGDGMKF